MYHWPQNQPATGAALPSKCAPSRAQPVMLALFKRANAVEEKATRHQGHDWHIELCASSREILSGMRHPYTTEAQHVLSISADSSDQSDPASPCCPKFQDGLCAWGVCFAGSDEDISPKNLDEVVRSGTQSNA